MSEQAQKQYKVEKVESNVVTRIVNNGTARDIDFRVTGQVMEEGKDPQPHNALFTTHLDGREPSQVLITNMHMPVYVYTENFDALPNVPVIASTFQQLEIENIWPADISEFLRALDQDRVPLAHTIPPQLLSFENELSEKAAESLDATFDKCTKEIYTNMFSGHADKILPLADILNARLDARFILDDLSEQGVELDEDMTVGQFIKRYLILAPAGSDTLQSIDTQIETVFNIMMGYAHLLKRMTVLDLTMLDQGTVSSVGKNEVGTILTEVLDDEGEWVSVFDDVREMTIEDLVLLATVGEFEAEPVVKLLRVTHAKLSGQ